MSVCYRFSFRGQRREVREGQASFGLSRKKSSPCFEREKRRSLACFSRFASRHRARSTTTHQVPQAPPAEEDRRLVPNRAEGDEQDRAHGGEDAQRRDDLAVGDVEVRAGVRVFASHAREGGGRGRRRRRRRRPRRVSRRHFARPSPRPGKGVHLASRAARFAGRCTAVPTKSSLATFDFPLARSQRVSFSKAQRDVCR